MPEHDPEQELGPKIASAFQSQADAQTELRTGGLAREARRRVRKRRQALSMAAAAVVVAAAIGGVWNLASGESSVSSTASDSSGQSKAAVPHKSTEGVAPPKAAASCPPDHPILQAGGHNAVPAGTGLDLNTPVSGLQACRYQLTPGSTALLGQERFSPEIARQVVDEIKVLPERNPTLPVFKCAPPTAQPSEAIVLRFDTAAGVREIWVEYDGCDSAGFFTGTHTYGLYAAPLKLFMTGSVRPAGGTYLDALKDW
jgi:hypothetical protein